MVGFLINAVAISMSGVLAPGPMTAATLAAGARNRHAGLLLAVGHGIVELPLMLLILTGVNALVQRTSTQAAIGLAGGVLLMLMGGGMLLAMRRPPDVGRAPTNRRGPVLTGIIMTGGNPYFLLWWATIGLTLAGQAAAYGALAFAIFAGVHWLCDAAWLEVLSQASHRGSKVFGARSEKIILGVCGTALVGFGVKFLYDAAKLLAG